MVTTSLEDFSQFALETIGKLGDKALSFYGKGNRRLKFDERLVTEAELHLSELFNYGASIAVSGTSGVQPCLRKKRVYP